MMKDAAKDEFDIIIVYDVTKFARLGCLRWGALSSILKKQVNGYKQRSKKTMKRLPITSISVVLILIGLVCPLARVQDNPIGGEEWQLSVTPYFWMAGIEGDVTIRGLTADIDLGFDTDKANIRERN